MATCKLCNDGNIMSRHGLKIHMGKIHDVHYGDVEADGVGDPRIAEDEDTAILADVRTPTTLVPCGHPFCEVIVMPAGQRAHWDADHPTWLMSDGRYVFEVR